MKFTLDSVPSVVESERARKLALFESVSELAKECSLRDVVLRAVDAASGEEVEIGASSAHLSGVSDYFRAMFEGDRVDKGETLVLSPKLSAAGVRAICALSFDVPSAVEVSVDSCAELLSAAEFGAVSSLRRGCDELLERLAKQRSVDGLARVASDLERLGLGAHASRIFDSLSGVPLKQLFMAPVRLPAPLFTSLLRADELGASEEQVWARCVAWAKQCAAEAEGDWKESMAALKAHIRFPLLSDAFLWQTVWPAGVLSDSELCQVCAAKHGAKLDLFCPAQPRKPLKPAWKLSDGHSLDDTGTVLTHTGRDPQWVCSSLSGVMTEGTHSVEFEINEQTAVI